MEKGALATGLACEWVGVGGGGLWGVARCGLGGDGNILYLQQDGEAIQCDK